MQLKTFPGLWVSPGGHVDKGEDFRTACLRELSEEVGIDIQEDKYNGQKVDLSEIFMYESVYPIFEMDEPPKWPFKKKPRANYVLSFKATC